jgi:hypothetical protein
VQVPEKQLARRQRAVAALGAHTAEVLDQLRDAEDELLAGEQFTCFGKDGIYWLCSKVLVWLSTLS